MCLVTWPVAGRSLSTFIYRNMKISVFIFILSATLTTGNEGFDSNIEEEAFEFEPPCPLDWNPDPCECTGHSRSRNIECSRADNGFQIRDVFHSIRDGLPFAIFKIQDSNLTSLSPSTFGLSNFTTFIITRTSFTSIPVDLFETSKGTVKEISITHTQLDGFVFNSLNNYTVLEILDLSFNRLTSIPSEAFGSPGLPRLQELNLRGNQITSIPSLAFSNLPYLERLDLSQNNLTKLSARSLSNPGMKEIAIVSITENFISEIDKNAFADLLFTSIHLENNKMEHFPEQIYESIVEYLYDRDASFYLDGNKFVCDESIKWLVMKPAMKKHHLRDFKCASGKFLEGLTVDDLKNKKQN